MLRECIGCGVAWSTFELRTQKYSNDFLVSPNDVVEHLLLRAWVRKRVERRTVEEAGWLGNF